MRPIHLFKILLGVYDPWHASWPITNSRAIHSAATSEANTLTHQASTTNRLAIAAPSTSQSRKNQTMGTAMARSTVNGCSIFWNLKRDLSATGPGASTISGSSVEGDCIQDSGQDAKGKPSIIRLPWRLSTRTWMTAARWTAPCTRRLARAVPLGTSPPARSIRPSRRPARAVRPGVRRLRSAPWRLPVCWRRAGGRGSASQVRRARRERADGSLSNRAGNSPNASTNSRIGAAVAEFGAGVNKSFSQVTQRFAKPARVIPRLVRRRDSPSARESARLR